MSICVLFPSRRGREPSSEGLLLKEFKVSWNKTILKIGYSQVIWWWWDKWRCYLASNKMQILNAKWKEKCSVAHFMEQLLQGNGQLYRNRKLQIWLRL